MQSLEVFPSIFAESRESKIKTISPHDENLRDKEIEHHTKIKAKIKVEDHQRTQKFKNTIY